MVSMMSESDAQQEVSRSLASVAGAASSLLASAVFLLLVACSPPARHAEVAGAEPAKARLAEAEPSSLGAVETAAPPRFVILVSIDTLRADHLGLYGYERFTSPVLDTFSLEGVVFDDASAAAPWTLPSHASMLTGLYPMKHRVITMAHALPEGVPTLATMLRDAGFETAAVVNSTWLKRKKYRVTKDFDKFLFVEEAPARRAPTRWVTDQTIEWMGEATDAPLFIFAHYYDVHSDYASQPAYEKLFVEPYDGEADGSSWQLTASSLDDDYVKMCKETYDPGKCRFGREDAPSIVDGSLERLDFQPEDVRHVINLYDAGVRQMDVELGRLLGLLRTGGFLDETLLVITSDHGEEFMEHGRLEHFLPTHQELLHVPLVIRGPGVPSGVRVAAPVSLIDLVPTILGMVRADSPYELDGRDLAPLWWEAASKARENPSQRAGSVHSIFESRYLFGEASGGFTYEDMIGEGVFPTFRSVRQGRYKLIHSTKPEGYSLYDVALDPLEQKELSAEQPAIARALKQKMMLRYEDDEALSGRDQGSRVQLDDDEIERLRALGYVP